MKNLILPVLSLVFLTGCATVITGTNQSIQVAAVDQKNHSELSAVSCTLKDVNGVKYPLVSNPGTVIVSKGREPLQVECRQPGYQPFTGAINSQFNPVTLLDILFWPTFFVDYGTGAMQKYPGRYEAVMSKTG